MFNDIKETNKRIATKIKSIAGRNKTLRADIQSVLCDIAAHTYQHGDVTAYNNLFTACKGQDRTALAEWITVYGFAILRPDGTFGKNKDAIANADYADAEAVFAEYTDEATIIPAWFTLVKSASQIAAAMKPSAMVLKMAADIGKHSDPHSCARSYQCQHPFYGYSRRIIETRCSGGASIVTDPAILMR